MLRLLMLFVVLSIVACASSSAANRDPEKVNDVMITFINSAKAGFWKEAMDCVTPSERSDMMEGGLVMKEYREAINRLRLSAIKNMEIGLDSKGRLVGIRDALDESNYGAQFSDEKSAIDPSLLKDLASEQRKRQEELEKARAAEAANEQPEEEGSFLESLLKESPKDL